jgi:hypothetical protein
MKYGGGQPKRSAPSALVVRYQKLISVEEKKTRINNEKRNVWMTALAMTMEFEGVYYRSGH